MNFQDYQNQAKRTLKCTMTDEQLISNLALGVAGESSELAYIINYYYVQPSRIPDFEDALVDECSDLAWYIFMIAEFFEYKLYTMENLANDMYYKNLAQLEYETPRFAILELVYQCGHLADYIKKIVYHKHSLDFVKLKFMIMGAFGSWIGFVEYYDLDISEILQHNIDKLWKRYPNGFNHDDSRKRQDVTNTTSTI